jgi:putative transposase
MTIPYDPERHHRRSIRVPDFDYTQAGAYFITVCVEQRRCLFGDVIDEMLCLKGAGESILRWWHEIARKYEHVETDAVVVMPNHLHGIILIDVVGLHDLDDHTGSPLPSLRTHRTSRTEFTHS